MENILLMDTSFSSLNKGDEIIMRCVKNELDFLLKDNFVLNLPTHIPGIPKYQQIRKTPRFQYYNDCRLKFVCGTNLLVPDAFVRVSQWNVNMFNYKPIEGSVLVGVGKGAGDKTNRYTTKLYQKILNHDYIHSARDERTKEYIESLGLKAYNTGCVTMWMLTPEFCKTIPTHKAKNVVFTLTARNTVDERDQDLINILNENYEEVYFWVQGISDYKYLHKFENIDKIHVIEATVDAYDKVLNMDDIDYVGTRLHAGIFAMRHAVRSVIIAIDERAREINKCNNLNCIEKDEISKLPEILNGEIITNVIMPLDKIEKWKEQFK